VVQLILKLYLKSKKGKYELLPTPVVGFLVEIYLKNCLSFQSQYIFSLLMFVVKNKDFFKLNSDFHTFNIRSKCDLHFPVVNLTVCQKGVCFVGIKLYNCLPITLKQISHDTHKFKVALKNFLAINSFYTVEEYYCHK
jgi:hypothetical protein